MVFHVRQLEPDERAEVRAWEWPDSPLEWVCVGQPGHDDFAIVDENDTLVGYCSFGPHAMIPPLHGDERFADVAWGMRPELVGQGNGAAFIRVIAEHGRGQYPGRLVRAQIRWDNSRSLTAATRAGFEASEKVGARVIVIYGDDSTSST
jgi:RimJ/RimL family protein N-acetyltransferase